MMTLEELKRKWDEQQNHIPAPPALDRASLEKLIRTRVKKQIGTSMHYFWAAFVLHVIVYALLSHVLVTYWQHTEMLFLSIGAVLLFVPFTLMLMRKFKRLAVTKPSGENTVTSLYDYVLRQQQLLRSFYNFKKGYEFILIPIACAIGVMLTFQLYVPGGFKGHWMGVVITFVISILSCAIAIRSENRKSFITPLQHLQNILDEFNQEV